MQAGGPKSTEPLALELRDLIAVFSEVFEVPKKMEGALRARLKHFQRLGFPYNANTGTGTRAHYTADSILRLGFALDLTRIQMTPEQAVALIQTYPLLMSALWDTAIAEPSYNPESLEYVAIEFPTELLSQRRVQEYRVARGKNLETLTTISSRYTPLRRRTMSIICVTYLVMSLNLALEKQFRPTLGAALHHSRPELPN